MRCWATASRAVETYRQALGLDPGVEDRSKALWGLASAHLSQGEYGHAEDLAREGITIVSSMVRRLSEEEGAGARDSFRGLFDVGVRAAVAMDDSSKLAWFLEHGRAGSLREALGSHEAVLVAGLSAEQRKRLAVVRGEETRALEALRRAGSRTERRAREHALAEAQAAVHALMVQIQREAKAAASLPLAAPDDLAKIRTYIEPGEVLVLYGMTESDALALLVHGKGARIVDLGATSRIEHAVGRLLGDSRTRVDPSAASELAKLVVEPLGLGNDVRRIILSPTGVLGYAPFSMLVPGKELIHAPSGTTYGLLLAQRSQQGQRILGLGDPDYRTVVNDRALGIHRGGSRKLLPPLAATRQEVGAVADVKLMDEKATETALRSALEAEPRWRAVHLACHGLVDAERPMRSSVAVTADTDTDGFLTCLEVLRMRIPADLVVLSACETGKGRVYATEGVVGLASAFMTAGARAVLCSLWEGRRPGDAGAHGQVLRAVESQGREEGTRGCRCAQEGAGIRPESTRSGSTRTTGRPGCCGDCRTDYPRRKRLRA